MSDGKLEFYQSSIYSNYATHNSFGQILGSSQVSIIKDSEIYSNEVLDGEAMIKELEKCDKLCFVSNTLKYALTFKDFKNFIAFYETFEIIHGALMIDS